MAAFLQRGTTLVIFAVRRMTATWDCCQTLQRSTQYTESFLIFEWIKVTCITKEGNFYILIYEYQQQYKNCKDISLEFFNANLKKWKKVRSKITELIISNAYLLFTSIVIVNILKCKSSLLGCIFCWDSQVCWFKEETLGL